MSKNKTWHIPPIPEKYGFRFGAATVTRAFGDERLGVCIQVATEHACVDLYISPKGKSIRIHRHGAKHEEMPDETLP